VVNVNGVLPSSFRDRCGFVFQKGDCLYRQINECYREHYGRLLESGLYEELVTDNLLIPHREVDIPPWQGQTCCKVIQPQAINFVSYPYEWCFSQLKDAALLTLRIQKMAMNRSLSLKDGSAYNVQFVRGKPIFIDTLSFEIYSEGRPWKAYKQFCQHFLAPLALMTYKDVRLNKLMIEFIDGIPLDLASLLLPLSAKCKPSLFSHIYLHAKSLDYFGGRPGKLNGPTLNRGAFLHLLDHLEATIQGFKWSPSRGEWTDYYADTNYSTEALNHKKQLVERYLERLNPGSVWDLGGNEGMFSRISSRRGIETISFDSDPAAVERNYTQCLKENEVNLLPLLVNLTHPSPNVGWHNEERMTLFERGPADTVLALALIHHLAISNNLPLDRCANFLEAIAHSLVIEFVPEHDSQVKRLLSMRDTIPHTYSRERFEAELGKYFSILDSQRIRDSERIIYLMVRKAS
jgi:hypothetical protein